MPKHTASYSLKLSGARIDEMAANERAFIRRAPRRTEPGPRERARRVKRVELNRPACACGTCLRREGDRQAQTGGLHAMGIVSEPWGEGKGLVTTKAQGHQRGGGWTEGQGRQSEPPEGRRRHAGTDTAVPPGTGGRRHEGPAARDRRTHEGPGLGPGFGPAGRRRRRAGAPRGTPGTGRCPRPSSGTGGWPRARVLRAPSVAPLR